MKFLQFCFTLIVLFSTHNVDAQHTVSVSGAMRGIMHDGDLSTHAIIDTINKKHLYGLGPVSGLKGEIIIIDGQVFSSTVVDGKIINGDNVNAAMLVYKHVANWQQTALQHEIQSIAEVEKVLLGVSSKQGFKTTDAFPFMIKGKASLRYHVIDWQKGHAHTADNHKQFAIYDTVKNVQVTILGFYSNHHKGVFTHHSSNMHMHVLTSAKHAGHVDDLYLLKDATLYLPGEE